MFGFGLTSGFRLESLSVFWKSMSKRLHCIRSLSAERSESLESKISGYVSGAPMKPAPPDSMARCLRPL